MVKNGSFWKFFQKLLSKSFDFSMMVEGNAEEYGVVSCKNCNLGINGAKCNNE